MSSSLLGSTSRIQYGSSDSNNYSSTRLPQLVDGGLQTVGNGDYAYVDFTGSIPANARIVWVEISEIRTLGTSDLVLQGISGGSPLTDVLYYGKSTVMSLYPGQLSGTQVNAGYWKLTNGTTTTTYWQGRVTLVRQNDDDDVPVWGQGWVAKWQMNAMIWDGTRSPAVKSTTGTGTLGMGAGGTLSSIRIKSLDGTTKVYGSFGVQYA